MDIIGANKHLLIGSIFPLQKYRNMICANGALIRTNHEPRNDLYAEHTKFATADFSAVAIID